ncbi:hypothetical protein ACCQ13_14930 [Xanthomonas sp. NCPPB 1638]|uniref:hypothetical protein n=1 Tax=Xanthomonas TaxID=338 RepID=UPI00132E8BA0|nr:hypothetical protein [Xanthomonas cucurbitae]QHG87977.1 hypothetical protein EBN15_14570 [Xanthomonas cucurbitae]
MRERTILFNGAMVRAILSGAKTQTRRPMKHQPQNVVIPGIGPMVAVRKAKGTDRWLWPNAREQVIAGCPFGRPGDRLWVRETWAPRTLGRWSVLEKHMQPLYRASEDKPEWKGIWRPSIHMPRWACRLVLEITDARVERLQAISEADALAEGAMEWVGEQNTPIRDLNAGDERIAFKALWESTGGDWDANPWVWVIGFRRTEQ